MLTKFYPLLFALGAIALLSSCQSNTDELSQDIPQSVIDRLTDMGFNPDGIEIVEEGYRIERDIIIRPQDLEDNHLHDQKGRTEKQYATSNQVSVPNGGRTITLYIPDGSSATTGRGKKPKASSGFNANYVAALDLAISRFNAENLELTFQRVTSTNADIVFTRLGKRDERQGVLGSAGFPTAAGDPYDEIKMSGIIDTQYGWSMEAISTVMAHEMGHCIGFRHTDYFDRSLSCGGGPANEGPSTVGANHIPGTPTGFSSESWMLACTGGGDRPFNNDDKVALDVLY